MIIAENSKLFIDGRQIGLGMFVKPICKNIQNQFYSVPIISNTCKFSIDSFNYRLLQKYFELAEFSENYREDYID